MSITGAWLQLASTTPGCRLTYFPDAANQRCVVQNQADFIPIAPWRGVVTQWLTANRSSADLTAEAGPECWRIGQGVTPALASKRSCYVVGSA